MRGGGSWAWVMARVSGLLGAFLAISLVAGFLMAGLALPLAGAAGLTASATVNAFDSLPAELEPPKLSEASTMYAADGRTLIARFYDENRIAIPLAKMGLPIQRAIIAIEDRRFYEHGGVDPKGVLRAFVNNQSGTGTQGASTLTQQYVKNALIETAVQKGDRSAIDEATKRKGQSGYVRKIREMRLALGLEKKLTKDQILEGYLNIALFGDNVYGVEAASRYYFNKHAEQLTIGEAAALAGAVQQPGTQNPRRVKAATARRNVVLKAMFDLKMINQKQYTDSVKAPLVPRITKARNGCINAGAFAYFCDYVQTVIEKSDAFKALGKNASEREAAIKRGGLTIITTIDPKIQTAAFRTVMKTIPATDKSGIGTAATTVEPGTGRILAMTQNRVFDPRGGKGQTTKNWNVDRLYHGVDFGWQPGSTFKAFTLAQWLVEKKSLKTVVGGPNSMTLDQGDAFKKTSCQSFNGAEAWTVRNAESGENHPVSVLTATAMSINTAFVNMARQMDLCDIAALAGRMGVHDPRTGGKLEINPSMILGGEETTPLAMANAYATFANRGTYCTPVAVVSIRNKQGQVLPVPGTRCTPVLDKEVAAGVTYALEGVIKHGTGGRAAGLGRPAAGKTGTASDLRDTWFVGYVPQRATAVWVAHPDSRRPGEFRPSLTGVSIDGKYIGRIFGGTLAAPIWKDIMKAAIAGLPVRGFDKPGRDQLVGETENVPDVAGMSVSEAIATLEEKGFGAEVADGQVPSNRPQGTVAYTTPGAGSKTDTGSSIQIFVSSGQAPPPGWGGPGQQPGQGGNNPGQQPTKSPKRDRRDRQGGGGGPNR